MHRRAPLCDLRCERRYINMYTGIQYNTIEVGVVVVTVMMVAVVVVIIN